MKKILVVLTALVLLSGCAASGNTQIGQDQELFTVNGKKTSQNDLYQMMKSVDAGTIVLREAQNMIVKDVAVTDAMKEEADSVWSNLVAVYGEATVLEQLALQGIASKEAYFETYIFPELKMIALMKDFITEDFDTLAETYALTKLRIVTYKDKDVAAQALAALKEGRSFDDVTAEFTPDSPFKGSEFIYIKGANSSIPKDIATYIEEQTAPTMSDLLEVVDSNSSTIQYIVQIIEVDAGRFKEDAIDAMVDVESIANTYLAKIFVENNFAVFDEALYNALLKSNPSYFGQ